MTGVPFDFSTQGQHIPDVERYIHTIKDRVQSCYTLLPFCCMPCIAIIQLLGNAIFWLNVFLHPDGISETLSLCYIMTGKHLDYHQHVRTEFGAYVQTHEEHSNDLRHIQLGPYVWDPLVTIEVMDTTSSHSTLDAVLCNMAGPNYLFQPTQSIECHS